MNSLKVRYNRFRTNMLNYVVNRGRLWFFVKATETGKGYIAFGNTRIVLPSTMIGKRVRVKIEVIE